MKIPPTLQRQRRRRQAFSLVEVTIALAVLAFACVSLIGMIPVAMINFSQAMNTSVESQISQYLSNDILLANFSDMPNYVGQTFYFDNEGSPLSGGTPPVGTIYTATVSTTAISSANSPTAFVAATTSALNVAVAITNATRPGQTNIFAFVVPNNNL